METGIQRVCPSPRLGPPRLGPDSSARGSGWRPARVLGGSGAGPGQDGRCKARGLIAAGDRIVVLRGSEPDDPTHNEIVVREIE